MPGEPGGFVLPAGPGLNGNETPLGFVNPGAPPQSYGQPNSCWENCPYPPMHPLSAGEPGGFIVPGNSYPRPQSPPYASQACGCNHDQYPRASQPYSQNAHATAASSQASAPSLYPRNVPSRQGSVSSRHSAHSHLSGASSTMVNGYTYPKHSQMRQQPYVQQPKQQPQSGPLYTWENVRYGR
ncbi:hypothetical protein IWW36_005164 [Coemansia brasiliensis]|uniref:Uncharacterized protein n=1 Tax=Coemansia brasiliensis TaxID=2650707 RepID=A0A9W8LY43_9FUNG|nr:hypothetical protein IWW36_005164 [Coemansia brasiliensis]